MLPLNIVFFSYLYFTVYSRNVVFLPIITEEGWEICLMSRKHPDSAILQNKILVSLEKWRSVWGSLWWIRRADRISMTLSHDLNCWKPSTVLFLFHQQFLNPCLMYHNHQAIPFLQNGMLTLLWWLNCHLWKLKTTEMVFGRIEWDSFL